MYLRQAVTTGSKTGGISCSSACFSITLGMFLRFGNKSQNCKTSQRLTTAETAQQRQKGSFSQDSTATDTAIAVYRSAGVQVQLRKTPMVVGLNRDKKTVLGRKK